MAKREHGAEDEVPTAKAVATSALSLLKSLEDQLKDQGKRGYPVKEGLSSIKTVRRYIKKASK